MILDTNAVSAVADNVPEAVQAFVTADSVAVPVVVLGEFRFGTAAEVLGRLDLLPAQS